MPDIITILSSVLLSGAGAAIISGYYNNNSEENKLRNKHLIEDKHKVREIINEINMKYLDDLNDERFSLDYNVNLCSKIDLLTMYLDENNNYTIELKNKYNNICQVVKDISIEWNNILDYNTEDTISYGDYPELCKLIEKRKKVQREIIQLISKYFTSYYYKHSKVKRIK